MDKDYFNFIIKDMPKNSVKRACYIVREYLKYSKKVEVNDDIVLKSNEKCAVTLEEYLEAVRILLAYSYENSDALTEVELHHCECDCGQIKYNNFCKGEFSVVDEDTDKTKNLKLCKYYYLEDK